VVVGGVGVGVGKCRGGGGMVKCEIFIQEMREYQFIFPPGTCSLQTHNLYTLKSAK